MALPTAAPIPARLMALADVFDALTSDRCYRAALPVDKALGMIREQRGKDFDPQVHDSFFDVLDEILELREIYKDE